MRTDHADAPAAARLPDASGPASDAAGPVAPDHAADDALTRFALPDEHPHRAPLTRSLPDRPRPLRPHPTAHRAAAPHPVTHRVPDAARSGDVRDVALDLVAPGPAGRAPAARATSAPGRVARATDDVAGEVVAATPDPVAGSQAAGSQAAGSPVPDTPADLAGLADRLWDHLEHRLRRSLLLERERRGVLPDL